MEEQTQVPRYTRVLPFQKQHWIVGRRLNPGKGGFEPSQCGVGRHHRPLGSQTEDDEWGRERDLEGDGPVLRIERWPRCLAWPCARGREPQISHALMMILDPG